MAMTSAITRYLNNRTILFIILAGFDVGENDCNPAHQVQNSKVRHEPIRDTLLTLAEFKARLRLLLILHQSKTIR